jgi:hypothetical protein
MGPTAACACGWKPNPGRMAVRLGPGIYLAGLATTPCHNDPGRPARGGLDAAPVGRWPERSAVMAYHSCKSWW